MRAMVLQATNEALRELNLEVPEPKDGEILLKVHACAVCRTDLHIIYGDLKIPKLPLIPGHEIVGTIIAKGNGVDQFAIGERVGVPWLGWTCGHCKYCLAGRENLCDEARFTGYTLDGGYAEYTIANCRFCFRIPSFFADLEAAPLLCAGLIGYRSLKKTENREKLGVFGFGAAAHIVTQIAKFQGQKVYAFTRKGDFDAQRFALSLGAVWAGSSEQSPPAELDAAIIFAPAGELVPKALRVIGKGGTVVCGGIHMSDIPSFPYEILWHERCIRSIANLTREDAREFLALAPKIPVRTSIVKFPLSQANQALNQLRSGKLQGAAVLVP